MRHEWLRAMTTSAATAVQAIATVAYASLTLVLVIVGLRQVVALRKQREAEVTLRVIEFMQKLRPTWKSIKEDRLSEGKRKAALDHLSVGLQQMAFLAETGVISDRILLEGWAAIFAQGWEWLRVDIEKQQIKILTHRKHLERFAAKAKAYLDGRTNRDRLPTAWHVFMGMILLASIGLILWGAIGQPTAPNHVRKISSQVGEDAWALAVGIVISGAVAFHYVIFSAMARFAKLFSLEQDIFRGDRLWGPVLLGFFESFLYPAALLVGQTQVILGWLLFKVAGGWVKGTKLPPDEGQRYNRYLLGNAMSLTAGAIGFVALRAFAS